MLVALMLTVPLVSYFIAISELSDFTLKLISIIGTVGSIAGLLYTIVQISLIRRESEVISRTASATKEQVLLLSCVADWARGIKVAQEIQNHCRNRKREIAIPRIQELKQILYDIAHSSDQSIKSEHSESAGDQILLLNVVINGFEKAPTGKMSSDEIASVNEMLEKTIDLLSVIQSMTKNKG
ncbi:hypothetical protein QYS36_20415 [Pseudomonas sp. G34]|uniref:hypothetical protein n=1 Tax=Pseudomonas sp. G34 TaxID=3059083 RepID=UPI00280850E4|nr:hypothetical protein [Pseudomonas sp. G34]MDQ7987312.1 hypothetical protein [Pseudomonas sp. G34]